MITGYSLFFHPQRCLKRYKRQEMIMTDFINTLVAAAGGSAIVIIFFSNSLLIKLLTGLCRAIS